MKTYYVLWTYIANHSSRIWKIRAASSDAAKQHIIRGFSDDFRTKGTVYVFDRPPVDTHNAKDAWDY